MPDTTVKKISVNKILVSNETPATTIAGKLWLNPSETPRPRLYEYNGTNWVRCGDTVTIDGVTLTIEQVIENLKSYIDTSLDKKVDWNILENNEIILKQGCDMSQQTYSPVNICSIDLAKPYSYCFNYRMNLNSGIGYSDTIFGNYNYTAGWKISYSLDTSSPEYVYNVYFEYVDQDLSKSIDPTLIDFPCTDDELHTLVVAYTGSEFKIYIDGTLKNTFATTATSYNATPIIYKMGDTYAERNLKNIYVFNFDITDANALYTLTDYLNGNVIPTNLLGGTFYTTKPSMGLDNASDWNITSALTVDRQQGGWLCKAGVAYCKQRSVADLPTGVEKALDLNTTTSNNYYLGDTADNIDHLAGKTIRVKISFWARKNSTDKSYSTYLYIYAGDSSIYSVSGSTASDNNWHKYETTKNVSISSSGINKGINIRAYAKADTFTDYAWSIADLHVELIGAAVALENYVYYEDVDSYTNCPLLKDTSANGNNYYSSYGSGSNYADNSILAAHPTFKPDLIKLIDINSLLPQNYSEDNSSGYRISKINGSLAEGYNTVVNNSNSNHAEGYGTQATGYDGAHAEGSSTIASGEASHAEGYNTQATVSYSHAEGYNTIANNYASHAEGYNTQATASSSHAEGNYTIASGDTSHAEGSNTQATAFYSHAEGYYTVAASEYQHVQGKYNVVDNNNTYADIIGGGTSSSDLKNIFTVDWNGNVVAEGNISGKVNGSTVSLSSLSADISTKAADSVVVKTVNSLSPTSGAITLKSQDITLTSNITVNGTTTSNVQTCLGKLNSEKVNTPVIGSLASLDTTDKTSIVNAINELNTRLLALTPAPITSSFTPDTTSLVSFITDSTKANIQGKVLISPNINNVGAIYVGQSVTDKANAFPLYPNQIVSFSFTDITNFKCAVDVLGDSFNYIVEFGVLNAAVTPAEGLIMVGTNGGQYQLIPSGESGSETFTITRIS